MSEKEDFVSVERKKNLVSLLVHHISQFLLGSRLGGYDRDQLIKSKEIIQELKLLNPSEDFVSKLTVVEGKLNSINTEDDVDADLLDDIQASLDAMRI